MVSNQLCALCIRAGIYVQDRFNICVDIARIFTYFFSGNKLKDEDAVALGKGLQHMTKLTMLHLKGLCESGWYLVFT